MQQKKLTGWLILLIIWIGVFGLSGGIKSLGEMADAYRPYFSEYPRLSTAIMVFQFFVGTGIAAWAYTAWLLYRREPGTLKRAQAALLLGALLRVVGGFSLPMLGGLSPELAQPLMQQAVMLALFMFIFTGIWHQYLARSQKVREIYSDA